MNESQARGRWNRRHALSAAILAVVALVALGCGGDDDAGDASAAANSAPPADEATSDPDGGSDEPFRLRQTFIGFANEINWVWAQEQGIFEEHGIELEPVQTGGGAAGVAAVMSGAADIGFVGGTDAIKAYAEGFPIKIVGAAYFNVNPPQPNGRGLVARAGSGIEGPCDLEGRKVALNELAGIGQIYAQAWVRQAGCDPLEVNFVALPAGQLHTALEEGRVDVAGLNAVRAQDLVDRGVGVLIGDPMGEVAGDVAFAVYVATDEFIDEHGDILDAWRDALDESLEQVEDPANHDEVYALMAEHGRTTVEILESTANEPQVVRVPVDIVQSMVDVMVQEGYLSETIDASGLLAPRATA